MKVRPIIDKFLTNAIGTMHKARMKSVAACIESVMNGNSLTVTGMGRGIAGEAYEKHTIKQSDRLCSNWHLYQESTCIYEYVCKLWVPAGSRPVILVDWSNLDDCKNAFLISATLVCDGRSITLYSQTHPLATRERPDTHQHFLETLKTLLPENCQPIIIADAGFKVPWHELVISLGWDYIGRVRKPNDCKLEGEETFQHLDEIFKKATPTPNCYDGELTKSNQFETTFILYKGPSKGRHKLTAEGERCCSKHSEQHAKSGKEPWGYYWPEQQPSTEAWLAVLVMALFCTSFAIILYFRLIANIGPSKTIVVTYLIPIFSMSFGAFWLDEVITLEMLLGCGLILTGVTLATGLVGPKPKESQKHIKEV